MKRLGFYFIILGLLISVASTAYANDYTFTTIDVPGATSNWGAFGINDSGSIVGTYDKATKNENIFIYYSEGIFTTIDVYHSWGNGINNSGSIVGRFLDGSNWSHNFLYSGGVFTTIDVPGATSNWGATGINDSGAIVGTYGDATGGRPGFLYTGGNFTPINVPGAVKWTVPTGISNSGSIVGTYENSDEPGTHRGFLYVGGNFTLIDVPGALGTDVNGINDFGDIVGAYYDAVGSHGFLYKGGSFTTIDVPGASYGGANGINNSGSIVGYYVDATQGRHGFIATPSTITVNPYSDEYVIMVGNAYDWPTRNDTSSGKLFYIPINPDGTFGNVSYITDLGYRSGAGIADFDNDGDLDFVAGAVVERGPQGAFANFYLFENVGEGKFIQQLIASHVDAGAASDNRVGTFAVADFNEDGYKDFVVPICKSDHVYLLTNNGNKTFTLSTLTPLNDPSDAKEGDFNGDGHMDFVVTDYFYAIVYLYNGDGNGAFTVQPLFDVAGDWEATDITAGDFDEDGHLDIIVDDFTPHAGGAHLYTGRIENGNLDFVYQGVVYSRPLLVGSTSYDNVYGVDSFDFDKDGHRDLILSTYEYPPAGLVFIMRGKGDGTFWPAEQILTPPIGALGSVFPVTPSEIPEDVTPPVLSLPNDLTVECAGPQGAVVNFVAAATDAIDGEVPVTCTPVSGSNFPLSATEVTCTASDSAGNTATGTFTVTINDTIGPVIQGLIAAPDVLWPPNHKMVPVSVVVQASDTCDPDPICTMTSVTSNEPDNGLGDGDTAPDSEIIDSLTAYLRSERSGAGSGRIYTITVQCMDTSQNSSIGTVNVSVPHDKGKK